MVNKGTCFPRIVLMMTMTSAYFLNKGYTDLNQLVVFLIGQRTKLPLTNNSVSYCSQYGDPKVGSKFMQQVERRTSCKLDCVQNSQMSHLLSGIPTMTRPLGLSMYNTKYNVTPQVGILSPRNQRLFKIMQIYWHIQWIFY